MDDLTCSGDMLRQTLKELRVINRWLGGNQVTVQGLKKLIGTDPTVSPVTIADLGSGGGDMIIQICKLARKLNREYHITGIDANENIIAYARDNTRHLENVSYQCMDVFSPDFRNQKFDYVTFTLFAHHFTNEQLIRLFIELKAITRKGIVVNDLHRHWLAYHSIRLLTKWFSRSEMVINDAPLSVARSFRRNDWQMIFRQADIRKYQVKWKWAFRWMITINMTD